MIYQMTGYECTSCGKFFGKEEAFDHHRVGVHAYTYSEGVKMTPIREDGRRCMTTEEMEADPYLILTDAGKWTRASTHARGAWIKEKNVNRDIWPLRSKMRMGLKADPHRAGGSESSKSGSR